MKNLKKFYLVIFLAAIAVGSFSFSSDFKVNSTTDSEVVACKIGQCSAIAKSTGQQCKLCVSKAGDSNCSKHK